MTAQFRIGGTYRAADGRVIRLVCPISCHDKPFYDGDVCVVVEAHDGDAGWYGTGWRRLSDGKYHGNWPSADLLPGELHSVNGEWVPVAEEAPKPVPSLGALLRQALERGNVKPADGRKEPSDPSALRDRDHIAPKQKRADFDPWKGFFTEPADIADWQDTYFPR